MTEDNEEETEEEDFYDPEWKKKNNFPKSWSNFEYRMDQGTKKETKKK